MLLDGGLRSVGFHLLHVGGDDDGLDLVQIGNPHALATPQQLEDGSLIGRACDGVAHAGSKELDEVPAGFLGGICKGSITT